MSAGLLALATALGLAAAGCSSVGFLAHVSAGQLGVLWARERLTPERIASLTPEEQEGLRWFDRAREYAAEIGLARSSSYRHLIERDPERAIQVVVASPADRLEAVTWWFPIVGRVAYRGYFDREKAERFAAGLADEGLDTYVRPALLYSTLGYFDDPIPRYALGWSPVAISDVTIHELVHETVFVPDDVAYNEALASFIAERATLELLSDRPELIEQAETIFADRRLYAETLAALAADLRALYERTEHAERARRERARLFARYQGEVYEQQPWRSDRYAGFRTLELNNAFVIAQQTYTAGLPCFERELDALAGDLRAFIARHVADPGHLDASCEAD